MGTIAIILGVLIIVIIIVDRVYQKSVKENILGRDCLDDNNSNNTSSRSSLYCSKEEPKLNEPSSVNINKYHESNEIVGKITKEYWRKYHESEGAYSQIHPSEADDFIMKYVIYIWNEVLDKEVTIKDVTLDGVISKAESQFKIWADRVEKKNSPESIERRLQANRKYLSDNKKKLILLDRAATYKQHQELLRKMQLRYNEIISSGNTFKESQLLELKYLGIKIDSIDNPKSEIPDIVFEVKGLFYRSAQVQLEATLLEVGDQLLLEEEPDNEYDASAVKVLTPSGECIGYVDKDLCVLVGAMINHIDSCTIIKKSRHQIPFITAQIKFKDKK